MVSVEVLRHRAIVIIAEPALLLFTLFEEVRNVDVVNVANGLLAAAVWVHAVESVAAPLGDLARKPIIPRVAAHVDGEWVEVALLPLEAEAHMEVVQVLVVILRATIYR